MVVVGGGVDGARKWNVQKSSIIRLSAYIRNVCRRRGPVRGGAIYFANMLRRLIFHFGDVWMLFFSAYVFYFLFFPPPATLLRSVPRYCDPRTCIYIYIITNGKKKKRVRIENAFRNSRWILNARDRGNVVRATRCSWKRSVCVVGPKRKGPKSSGRPTFRVEYASILLFGQQRFRVF